MCDIQTKLIAWLDCELPAVEATDAERHVAECKECRASLAAYKRVSDDFDFYCDATMSAKTRLRVPRWVPLLPSVAAVAAVVLFLAFPRNRVEPPVLPPALAAASVPVPAQTKIEPVPRNTIHKRPATSSVHKQAVQWQPPESAVQIAIPADAMFPPGAMPKDLNFVAELSIAPDGSVRQVRLRQ
jgi:Putative zinc-finger